MLTPIWCRSIAKMHERKLSLIASSWGQLGAHLWPTGPRWAPCWPHELCYLGSCLPRVASHGNNRIYSLSVYCLHRLDTSLWNPRETRKWVCSERMMHWIKKIHWFYCREQFSYLLWFYCLCLRQTSNAVSPGFYHKFQAHFLTNVKHS